MLTAVRLRDTIRSVGLIGPLLSLLCGGVSGGNTLGGVAAGPVPGEGSASAGPDGFVMPLEPAAGVVICVVVGDAVGDAACEVVLPPSSIARMIAFAMLSGDSVATVNPALSPCDPPPDISALPHWLPIRYPQRYSQHLPRRSVPNRPGATELE
jgi:hypothetical protein